MFMGIESFIWLALFTGIGVAVIAGTLGCFVVWRRMAYFGDSLSHSALLGIALGVIWGVHENIAILLFSGLFALLLAWLEHRKGLSTDTLLGILAHAGLAIGMIVVSLIPSLSFELHSYLFGDLLTVTWLNLIWVVGIGLFLLSLIHWQWESLLLSTLHQGLAQAEGVPVFAMRALLMFGISVLVAVSVQVVGILLITALLIIPAATARLWAHSPESMIKIAIFLGVISVGLGLQASLLFDTPSGPSIVASSVVLFALSLPLRKLIR